MFGEQVIELAPCGVLPGHDAQADFRLTPVAGRPAGGHRAREPVQRGRGSLVRSDLECHIKKTRRSPVPVGVTVIRRGIAAERDREPHQTADDDDQILKGAMALLADRPLTVVDERARRRKIGDSVEEKPAETLSRGVIPRRIVEAPDEREQFGERNAHWARESTMAPDGAALPGADSSVTRTPTMGRGTSGGLSVASVTRPEASGSTVPALTPSPAVSSQI